MCDRGFTEANPEYMKLADIRISPEIQDKLIKGISELLGGVDIAIETPKRGIPNDDTWISVWKVGDDLNIWNNRVCTFSMSEFPGCCGIVISHNTTVYKKYEGKGINTFLQEIKEDIAVSNGYSKMLATVVSTNEAEIHILEKAGWRKALEFVNKRTGNTVLTYLKDITALLKGE